MITSNLFKRRDRERLISNSLFIIGLFLFNNKFYELKGNVRLNRLKGLYVENG